jgi:hypothetical protein
MPSKQLTSLMMSSKQLTLIMMPNKQLTLIMMPLRLNFRSILGQVKSELKRKIIFAIDFSVKHIISRS